MRHPALHALSEDHHQALVLAKRLREATPATAKSRTQAFLSAWRSEVEPHFAAEEQSLLPFVCPPVDAYHPAVLELLAQHVQLRRLVLDLERAHFADDAAARLRLALDLGAALDRHIRHEERTVFEVIQTDCPPELLEALGAALATWRSACVAGQAFVQRGSTAA